MSRFEPLWNTVCAHDHMVSFGLMSTIMLFVMAVISLLLVQPGTANFYITIFNVVLILTMAGPLLYAHRRCAKREMSAYEIDRDPSVDDDDDPTPVEGRGLAATPVGENADTDQADSSGGEEAVED